ncbi:cobaltochelatase subunit CobN [Ekhidna sp.]
MNSRNLKLFHVLVFLFIISAITNAQNQSANIGLILPDNYHQLGESVKESAYKKLIANELDAEITTYYYSDLDQINYQTLSNHQLIFIDIVNPAKVEGVLPLLNQMGKTGVKVFAVGSEEAAELGAFTDIIWDTQTLAFYEQSGRENLVRMVLDHCRRTLGADIPMQSSIPIPDFALCNIQTKQVFTEFVSYRDNYEAFTEGNPWIAINLWRSDFLSEQLLHFQEYVRQFEDHGFNVLCYYGFPTKDDLRPLFFDENKELIPEVLLAQSAWLGSNPIENREAFETLGIPVINLIQVGQNAEEWMENDKGIKVYRRANELSVPEQMGSIHPIVTTSRETIDSLANFTIKSPIIFQVKRLVKKVQKLHILQNKPNNEKQIAVIYYSHPPGKELLGASYLNVVPNSIHSILDRMRSEGYELGDEQLTEDKIFDDVSTYGINVGDWAPREIDKLVEKGGAILIPIDLYLKWYSRLSSELRKEIEEQWGKPEDNIVMKWIDNEGEKYIVIPNVRYGNVLLTPQPVRGWSHDLDIMHHDISVPPHHQYIAFYLYLRYGFQADAVVHLGTHGTLEWLPGKETGLNQHDASEALIGDMVNVYPYIVDDVGEGLQAKRRSGAIIIDHMTPPFDRININPELKKLERLISEHEIAEAKSPGLAQAKFKEIYKYAKEYGIMADLELDTIVDDDELHYIEHYIEEIQEQHSPLGLHTFGKLPKAELIEKNVQAIVSQKSGLSQNELKAYTNDIRKRIMASGESELAALIDALDGKYVHAATGNDPLRNPNSLPTGKNFYAFDADYVPSPEVYKEGTRLANELIKNYQLEHNGEMPDKLTYNLWATECIRNEGIMESQILSLLGVAPVYDAFGKVSDLKIIPRKEMNHPRIDIILIPSGLYRDIFPQLVLLLDKAVKLANQQEEVDNYVRRNTKRNYKLLIKKGVNVKMAKALSEVRTFSTPDGVYGTGTNTVVDASGSWEDEKEVADVFMNRMHFPYSKDYWGTQPIADSLLLSFYKQNLSGTKVVLHSITTHLYAALDNDDFFQYLGGTALAVRAIDGASPEVLVSNLTDEGNMKHEKLKYFLSKEMNTRYLNPTWINAMLDEGYSGSRFIRQVSSNLWGWQVTVPEAVEQNKWDGFFEVYVKDKYELDISQRFEESGNLYAYQVMISRLYEAIRKSYWSPDDEVKEKLLSEFLETVEKVGLSCNLNVCNNLKLEEFLENEFEEVQGLSKESIANYRDQLKGIKEQLKAAGLPSPDQIAKEATNSDDYLPKKKVQGFKIEEVKVNEQTSSNVSTEIWKWLALSMVLIYCIVYFVKKRRKIED